MIRDNRLGNTPRWYLTPPKDYGMRVPDSILECVAFLGTPKHDNAEEIMVQGTAFFVSVPSERDPHRRYEYLVTAYHNLHEAGSLPLYVRLNPYDGDARDLLLGDADTGWYHHPSNEPDEGGDPSAPRIDVSVRPWDSCQEEYRYTCLPASMFLTDAILEQRDEYGTRIGIGDEVFVVGLFTRVTGHRMNLPILRTGNVAMMPSEPIPTEWGDMEAYLIEARSIGGLSGSPVLVRYTNETGLSREQYLMGVMHGHWDTLPGTISDVATDAALLGVEAQEKVNMGIGITVPAKRLQEVLNQRRLTEMRAREDRKREKRNWPTQDTST